MFEIETTWLRPFRSLSGRADLTLAVRLRAGSPARRVLLLLDSSSSMRLRRMQVREQLALLEAALGPEDEVAVLAVASQIDERLPWTRKRDLAPGALSRIAAEWAPAGSSALSAALVAASTLLGASGSRLALMLSDLRNTDTQGRETGEDLLPHATALQRQGAVLHVIRDPTIASSAGHEALAAAGGGRLLASAADLEQRPSEGASVSLLIADAAITRITRVEPDLAELPISGESFDPGPVRGSGTVILVDLGHRAPMGVRSGEWPVGTVRAGGAEAPVRLKFTVSQGDLAATDPVVLELIRRRPPLPTG